MFNKFQVQHFKNCNLYTRLSKHKIHHNITESWLNFIWSLNELQISISNKNVPYIQTTKRNKPNTVI